MEFDLIGILLMGVAIVAALVFGALAGGFVGAVRNGVIVWVLFLVGWYFWGPPLPYIGIASNAFAAIVTGIVLCFAASVVHWVKALVKGAA